MSEQFFFAFDSETGGLDSTVEDILTFYGAIMTSDFKIVDEVNLKLKPDGGRFPIANAGALRVNGIDLQAHMADPATVTYSEGKQQLVTMLKKYHKKQGRFNNIKPFGYNVPFDEGFTWQHLLPKSEWLELMHYKRVDVMERVDFLKETSWFPQDIGTLATVNDYLQLPRRNAHNAKEDTLMTVDVYKKLLEIMKSKKDGGTTQDLISLLEAE